MEMFKMYHVKEQPFSSFSVCDDQDEVMASFRGRDGYKNADRLSRMLDYVYTLGYIHGVTSQKKDDIEFLNKLA